MQRRSAWTAGGALPGWRDPPGQRPPGGADDDREPLGDPGGGMNARTRKPAGADWPARYAIRRLAWHVLDHAWEIEDKSG